ncbi:hypothetical protein Pelo_56 [Pelomyxa schiedti]|nr:hypothetical protein Pelo_56 [Pelomyxa schiedti]
MAAYTVSKSIAVERIASDSVEDAHILETLTSDAIIVVLGSSDNVEVVLRAMQVPHRAVSPSTFETLALVPSQTVYINCDTKGYTPQFKEKVKRFVECGGQVITTDWVLNMLLQEIFPGTITYSGASCTAQTVPITVAADDPDEVLKGFVNEKTWVLAGGSHPVTVADPHRVKVLISSEQLGSQYGGCSAVLVRFNYGEGVVYHMISHFNLQCGRGGAQPATSADRARRENYVMSKGVSEATRRAVADTDFATEDIQAASTNAEFVMRNVIQQQKKKSRS